MNPSKISPRPEAKGKQESSAMSKPVSGAVLAPRSRSSPAFTFRGDYKYTRFGAYSKINSNIKSSKTDYGKMEALKAHLQTYRDSLPEKHNMRVPAQSLMALLDKGMAETGTGTDTHLPETEGVSASPDQQPRYVVQKDETLAGIGAEERKKALEGALKEETMKQGKEESAAITND